MAVDLLSYRGDKNLGSGSSPDIPVTYDKDLDTINRTANQIMLMRAAQNKQLFDQRIADRDNLIKAIDEGQIKVGDVLEKDDPTVKKALDDITVAYTDMMKNGGLNNLDAVRKYKNAVKEAKSVATQAQTRFLDMTGARKAIASETNPVKRQRMQQNLDEYEKKGFWADYTPPQDFQDLNMDEVIKLAVPIQSEYVDPANPLKKVKESSFSYDAILQKANEAFLDDTGRENQRILLEQLESLDPITAKNYLEAANRQLQLYATQTGKPAVKIDYQVLPNGRIKVAETLPNLAAKVSLASQPKFKSASSELDKGELEIAKLKEDIRSAKAREANDRGRLGLDWSKFNYEKEEDKYGASAVLNEAADILDKGEEVEVESGGKKIKVLRIGDPNLLKTFGNIDKDGKVTNIPDVVEYDRNKDQVKLVYYEKDFSGNTKKTASGKNIIAKDISLDQRTWLKEIAKRSFPNKDIGKVNTIVDDVITKSGNSLYKLSQGGNATTISINDIPTGTKPEKRGSKYYYNGKEVIF